ncbi:MAG: hypothetical protein ACYS0F_02830 [Planctomycetota bacterium]|jgi:hypothetical protein
MTIVIRPAPDRTLDFIALRRALAREGVRPGRMFIVADGEVVGDQFRIDGWPASYPLTGAMDPGRTQLRASVLMDGVDIRFRPAN